MADVSGSTVPLINRLASAISPMQRCLLVAVVLLVGYCYAEPIGLLVQRWNIDPNYGHGYLVVAVAGYLAYRRIAALPVSALAAPPVGGMPTGILLVGVGLGIRAFTVIFPSTVIESASLLVVLLGLVRLLGGSMWWQVLAGPIAFLVFMVPIPSPMYSVLAFPLQLFVSQASAVSLEILNIPVFRDGNVLRLPGQTMHVAEACSGLRQLTAFVAMGVCAAMLMARPLWYRLSLVLSAVPIALAVNIIRVVGTGLVATLIDPSWTEGILHTAEGMLTVGLGMVLFFAEIKVLEWVIEPANISDNSMAVEVKWTPGTA